MKIAIVQAKPSKSSINTYFKPLLAVAEVDNYCLTSRPDLKRILVKDIDIQIDLDKYDYVILVGAEPLKYFSKQTSITQCAGTNVRPNPKRAGEYQNLLAVQNPWTQIFRPEAKEPFEMAMSRIMDIVNGVKREVIRNTLIGIRSTDEAIKWLTKAKSVLTLSPEPILALDTETTGLYARKCHPLGVSASVTHDEGVYIDADCITDEVVSLLQDLINTPNVDVVLHNLKFDWHILEYHMDISFELPFQEGRLHDTMLEHYVLDERAGTHGLKHLANKYTDMGNYDEPLDTWKREYCERTGTKLEDFTYDLIPWDIISPYACMDTIATYRLHQKFKPLVYSKENLKHLYTTLMIPGTRFLKRVEDNGFPLNVKRCKKAIEVAQGNLNSALEELYTYPIVKQFEADQGAPFNYNSPVQLRTLLFDYCGLRPSGIKTDTNQDSTNAEALKQMSEQSPIAMTLLTLRKWSKILSTYLSNFIKHVDFDGRLRSNFNLHVTTSGRLSSSGTANFQNFVRDDAIVKGMFSAPKGYKFVMYDLVSAEVWWAACLSGDKALQNVFVGINNDPKNSADPHSIIAHMVFKPNCLATELKKMYPALRQAAKAIQFSILYGSGKESMAESINEALLEDWIGKGKDPALEPEWCTVDKAQEYIDLYFQMFPQLKVWVDECHRQIRTRGFLISPVTGRKRRAFNYKSPDRSVVAEEIRSVFNALIQGTSSDVLLWGCIEADQEIEQRGLDIQILGLVHDSVIALVPDNEEYMDIYDELIKRHVRKARPNGTIDGAPLGLEADSEEGGSENYSGAKLKKQYPELFAIEME